MADITDGFAGTNGDSINGRSTDTGGKTWTATNFQVFSNQANSTGAGRCVVDAGVTDYTAAVAFTVLNDSPQLVFRYQDSSHYLVAYVRTIDIRVFDNTFGTQFGSTYSGTVTPGDVVSVDTDAAGNIVVKQNGVTRVTTTSATYATATSCGLASAGSGDRFDDFAVTFAGSPPPPPPPSPLAPVLHPFAVRRASRY